MRTYRFGCILGWVLSVTGNGKSSLDHSLLGAINGKHGVPQTMLFLITYDTERPLYFLYID